MFLVMCSELVKKLSSELNHAAIGRLFVKQIESIFGSVSALGGSYDLLIYNDNAVNLELLADDLESEVDALQEAQSASGDPVNGPMLNGSDDDNGEDDSAKLRATSIHKFALRRVAGQLRRSLATAKKDAEAKEAATTRVQESDEDTEMEM